MNDVAGAPEPHRLVLEITLSSLVADRTIEGMVGEEELHDTLSCHNPPSHTIEAYVLTDTVGRMCLVEVERAPKPVASCA
jgi:hypothetical protein